MWSWYSHPRLGITTASKAWKELARLVLICDVLWLCEATVENRVKVFDSLCAWGVVIMALL